MYNTLKSSLHKKEDMPSPPARKKPKKPLPSRTENELAYARWLDNHVSERVDAVPSNSSDVFAFDSTHAKDARISYAHLATIAETPSGLFCAAFQCSSEGCEGKPGQHIRFCTSKDRGRTWSDTTVPMYGLNALWSPVLHCEKENGELLLFYSESRKQLSPGGDVKLIRSRDDGKSWSEPETLMTHERYGGVPKVIANRACGRAPRGKDDDGVLRLPFWTEPTDSWLRYRQYHPMAENASLLKQVYSSPPGSADDNRDSVYCGTIDSRDGGKTWETPSIEQLVSFPKETWLIENSVVQMLDDGLDARYLMYMRSATGQVWYCKQKEGDPVWSKPVPIQNLPNPNSKVSAETQSCVCPDEPLKRRIYLAINPSQTLRAPLGLSIRTIDPSGQESGKKTPFIEIEDDPNGNFAYPTTFQTSTGDLFVIYSVWGVGIRVHKIPLETLQKALGKVCNNT